MTDVRLKETNLGLRGGRGEFLRHLSLHHRSLKHRVERAGRRSTVGTMTAPHEAMMRVHELQGRPQLGQSFQSFDLALSCNWRLEQTGDGLPVEPASATPCFLRTPFSANCTIACCLGPKHATLLSSEPSLPYEAPEPSVSSDNS